MELTFIGERSAWDGQQVALLGLSHLAFMLPGDVWKNMYDHCIQMKTCTLRAVMREKGINSSLCPCKYMCILVAACTIIVMILQGRNWSSDICIVAFVWIFSLLTLLTVSYFFFNNFHQNSMLSSFLLVKRECWGAIGYIYKSPTEMQWAKPLPAVWIIAKELD